MPVINLAPTKPNNGIAMPIPEPLAALPGQPLCANYTGASLADLRGDYECKCLAGIPYERWAADMERWPCRRRHLLGLEQHSCAYARFGSDLSADTDEQVLQNNQGQTRSGEKE